MSNQDNFNTLRLISYNCNSIRKKVDIIRHLLSNCDILMCQEIILLSDETDFIYNISDDFNVFVNPSKPSKSTNFEGRPSGGMAIFWRKSSNLKLAIEVTHDNFILASVSIGSETLTVANIYMPSDDRSLHMWGIYGQILGELQEAVEGLTAQQIVLLGDFNADPNRGRMWKCVQDFVASNNLTVSDLNLQYDTFTYLSPAHNTTSWLDHVICSKNTIINDIHVKYNCALFDHFPISFSLSVKSSIVSSVVGYNNLIAEMVNWKEFDNDAKNLFAQSVESDLTDIFICDKIGCIVDHREHIDASYERIINALKEGTRHFVVNKNKKFKAVPGWNVYCKQLYGNARAAFLDWKNYGKIRHGAVYERMKETRKLFVNALNFCKNNVKRISNENLAVAVANRNSQEFWKEVRSRRGTNNSKATEIDGIGSPSLIADLFGRKFNAVSGKGEYNTNLDEYSEEFLPNVDFSKRIYVKDVEDALNRLKVGIGFDGIHSNHLKFSSRLIKFIFARLINSCFIHNHVPTKMLEGVISPCIKDKLGVKSSSANYREVMISPCFFKLFEYCVLPRLTATTQLSHLQFGYRSQSSTLLATALLKETVNKFVKEGSVVYSCFLDLSKAFERLDHELLLKKLADANLPSYLISIFKSIFCGSFVSVNYGGFYSKKWQLRQGVRQGGILSAYIFSFYMNDVLETIFNCPYGCRLGVNKISIQAYADDIVLIAPTPRGLQFLIDKINECLTDHKMTINLSKTVVMIFKRGSQNVANNLSFVLNGLKLDRVTEYKYLGSILSSDMSETLDMEKCMNAFNKSFGFLFRKFQSVNPSIFYSLFISFCASFYGSELWVDRDKARCTFRKLSVCYHNALKKILGFPRFYGNHFTCSLLNAPTFEHFMTLKVTRFMFWLKRSWSPCFYRHKFYFLNNSVHVENFNKMWLSKYDVTQVLDNDIEALFSRIVYVQDREPSSMYFL